MKPSSIEAYAYPDGPVWKALHTSGKIDAAAWARGPLSGR